MGNSKPKILYTTADASPQSGAFRCLLSVSRGIAVRGYEPILALHHDARERALLTREDRERTHFFGLPRAKRGQPLGYYLHYACRNIRGIYDLARLIRTRRIALVHVNEILDLYGGLAARLAGVPCVWHVRADLAMVPRLSWLLSRVIPALCDKVIVPSNSVRDRMFRWEGQQKVVVVHESGPDPDRFHPGVDGSHIRDEFGLNDGDFLVTLVAKLTKLKGHKTLVQAAPRVLVSFPNTRFLIVGGELSADHHKEYANNLKSLSRELGIQDKVVFTGFRSDVPGIMAASDIITHCSTYPDPFPGVVLEGMAVGRSVIASNLGGASEQIEDGVSGVLVDPADPKALADEISRLLANPTTRKRIGHAAAARVRSAFGAWSFFRRLTTVYAHLVN